MKATVFEFRFRYAIHLLLYALGFAAPWNSLLHLDPAGVNAHVWGLLAVDLTRLGIQNLFDAFNLLLIVAIVLAFAGALLRTWASAYLGTAIVSSGSMHTAEGRGDRLLKEGPYRFVRNPLYLGTFLHTIALTLLMSRSGALFTIMSIGFFQLRLIASEEAFLSRKLGEGYTAYCALVPTLLPTLQPKVSKSGLVPQWGRGALGEIYFWGVATSFAVAGWRYNANLLLQCVVVSLGVSFIARATTATRPQQRV